MKNFSLLILTWLLLSHTHAQTAAAPGVDCNPRLNEKEISHLSNMFAASHYDFKNKTIGFAAHKVKKICRSRTSVLLSMRLPISKKEYFNALAQDKCETTTSKLLVLNEEQKKQSGGFDAIIVIVSKKKEKKIDDREKSWLVNVFGYRTLNYPGNLHLVGNDNIAELTNEDAAFFNTIYHDRNFDFQSKKIAFMNPHLIEEKEAIRTKKEYIEKIKKHLEDDFLYPTDELVILNEQEKKESGGYDAMIVYQTKRVYKDELIQILKEHSK